MLLCLLWCLPVRLAPPSAPLSWVGKSTAPSIQTSVGLAYGWGRLALSKVTLPAVQHQTTEHAGLNLLKVVRLSTDFSLQEADVRLIASLLLKDSTGRRGAFRHKDQRRNS